MQNQEAATADIQVLGLDVGGANLKAAFKDAAGTLQVRDAEFPMWRKNLELTEAVEALAHELFSSTFSNQSSSQVARGEGPSHVANGKGSGHVALTMTGELADCFANRAEGVKYIVESVARACPTSKIHVYSVEGRWLTTDEAIQQTWNVAASNWHALASWVSNNLRQASKPLAVSDSVLVVDIGSTTADIIPVGVTGLLTEARTDRDRLALGQLVYTGIERTPVCAIVSSLKVAGVQIPIMAERFADSLDAYLVLGLLDEQSNNLNTADGRPRTSHAASGRLARMIGEDAERLQPEDLCSIANQIVEQQVDQIASAIDRNMPQGRIYWSGHGFALQDKISRKLGDQYQCIHLRDTFGELASRCAPAFAVSELLRQELCGFSEPGEQQ
ncbi:MAG: hydantoinase/oxoprolinase family protein [Planctomycetota bacterium]